MVTLVALVAHSYAGRAVKVGQTYQAARQHARVLIARKRARLAETPAPAPEVVPEPEPAKRKYRRRDLQAADAAPVIEPTHPDADPPTAHTYDTTNLKADE